MRYCTVALLFLNTALALLVRENSLFGAASTNVFDVVQATRDPVSGQVDITENGKPVLRYNYETVAPGQLIAQIISENRKYARSRSDYIHPLYGLDGQTLTKDWSLDHPHHRGIYWAWPEVTYRRELGDLHALQRVYARPTGQCTLRSGSAYAEVKAENRWLWEDREAIVREEVTIRAYRSTPDGRWIDLELRFVALGDDVAIARRGTDKYGGLNIRMAAPKDQQIVVHADAAGAKPRRAWADFSGTFPADSHRAGLTILQNQANPNYPGDWIDYPDLNWFQPTFPAAGERFILRKGQPLFLRFRFWVHRGGAPGEQSCIAQWNAFQEATATR